MSVPPRIVDSLSSSDMVQVMTIPRWLWRILMMMSVVIMIMIMIMKGVINFKEGLGSVTVRCGTFWIVVLAWYGAVIGSKQLCDGVPSFEMESWGRGLTMRLRLTEIFYLVLNYRYRLGITRERVEYFSLGKNIISVTRRACAARNTTEM